LGIAAFLSKAELCTQTGSQAGAWEPEEKTVFGFLVSVCFQMLTNGLHLPGFLQALRGSGRAEKILPALS